ncbi:MAG: hypothetical protein R2813_09770 [Flavobacteriales bacterium]
MLLNHESMIKNISLTTLCSLLLSSCYMRPLVRFSNEDRTKNCADEVVMHESEFRYVSYRYVWPRMAVGLVTVYSKPDGKKTQKIITRAITGANNTVIRKTKTTMYEDGKIDYVEKHRVQTKKD